MKAYSLDLRERVIAAVETGTPWPEIVRLFGISRATLNRYRRRQRQTGSLVPGRSPGRPRVIPPAHEPALQAQLAATPDATIGQHCQTWQAHQGHPVHPSAMRRAIARVGWTRKKRPSAPVSATRAPARPGGTRPRTST